MRISNSRVIADIEFVIEPPSAGSLVTTWSANGVTCIRDWHRFSGSDYSFAIDLIQIRHEAPRKRWQIVIVSETWRFRLSKGDARPTKSLRVLEGKASDVLAWMRHSREQKTR
jgi:hypothetical protein